MTMTDLLFGTWCQNCFKSSKKQ